MPPDTFEFILDMLVGAILIATNFAILLPRPISQYKSSTVTHEYSCKTTFNVFLGISFSFIPKSDKE